MNKYIALLLLAILGSVACSENKHHRLIGFESRFYRDLTEAEWENGGDVPTEIRDSIAGDTLYVFLHQQQAGCMAFDGNIEVHEDTIFLGHWHSGTEVCDELVVYQMTYAIRNPERKAYVFHLQPDKR